MQVRQTVSTRSRRRKTIARRSSEEIDLYCDLQAGEILAEELALLGVGMVMTFGDLSGIDVFVASGPAAASESMSLGVRRISSSVSKF